MLDMKIAIETYFSTSWTGSPIQWQGMRFEQPNDNRWIHISFIGLDSVSSINGSCSTDTAQVRISSYGPTPNKSLGLDRDVRQFLEFYRWDKNGIVESYEPDGFGTIDLGTGTFETTSLYLVKTTKDR